MSGHTPGPWAVSKQKARRVTANGVIICNAVLRNQGGPKAKANLKDEHEAEANADLIALAPTMLKTLRTIAAKTSVTFGRGNMSGEEAASIAKAVLDALEATSPESPAR